MWVRRIDALTEFDDGGAAPDGHLIDERRTARVGLQHIASDEGARNGCAHYALTGSKAWSM